MKIIITQAIYKNGKYDIYYTYDKEDGSETIDYQVQAVNSYGGFTEEELKEKVINSLILKQTDINLDTNSVIEVEQTITQAELDYDLKEKEVNEQKRKVSIIINGIKEDKELFDKYMESEAYTTLTEEERTELETLFKTKLDTKWKEYKTEKELLETLKSELETMVV